MTPAWTVGVCMAPPSDNTSVIKLDPTLLMIVLMISIK